MCPPRDDNGFETADGLSDLRKWTRDDWRPATKLYARQDAPQIDAFGQAPRRTFSGTHRSEPRTDRGHGAEERLPRGMSALA